MWPWGHLAFGYLVYSLASRATFREAPTGGPTLLLAVASQLPDLVDKPLSWTFGVFVTGYGAGHSVFVAVPVVAAAAALARRTGRERWGLAFCVGYAAHLAGDVLLESAIEREASYDMVLWPVAEFSGYAVDRGFFGRFSAYLVSFAADVLSGEATFYLALYVVLFTSVFALWLYDGLPVAREAARWLADRRAAGRRDRP
ncbi:metal-dependent hydrolase [Halobacterium yunchengense]|uniref:metal-dependent hydrolase n=1 Tax=Halobacterium yunchengense TaxID=3108497 RepID=UPI00300906FB